MKNKSVIRFAGILATCCLVVTTTHAQTDRASEKEGYRLDIRFALDGGSMDLGEREELTVVPVVVGREAEAELEPVVFTGWDRYRDACRRAHRQGGMPQTSRTQVVLRHNRGGLPENTVIYENTIPYEAWMEGGRLVLRCRLTDGEDRVVALRPMPIGRIVAPVAPRIAFIVPAEALDPMEAELNMCKVYTRPESYTLAQLCALSAAYPLDSPECAYICSVAMERFPDDPCVSNNMAALAIRRGDVRMAYECLDRFVDEPLVQNNLGIVWLIKNDRTNARRCFENARSNGSSEGAYNLAHFESLTPRW